MRLPLRTKLFAGFGAVVALTVLLGVVSIIQMGSMNAKADYVSTGVVPAIDSLGKMDQAQSDYRSSQFQHAAETSPAAKARLQRRLQADDAAVAKAFEQYRPTIVDAADRGFFDRVSAEWAAYKRTSAPFLPLSAANRSNRALAVLQGAPAPAYDRLEREMGAWTKLNLDFADQARSSASSSYATARTITIAIVLTAIVVSMLIALLLSRSIMRGVADILDRLTRLRDNCVSGLRGAISAMIHGDLTQTVTPTTQPIERITADEIGDVARAVNEIRDNTVATIEAYNQTREALGELIGQVASSAGVVAASSQQMASTSEEAGRAVGEIANAVGDVAQGAERQVQMVEATRASAEETNQAAEGARQVAERGAGAAEEASRAMAAVRDSSSEVSEAMRSLATKSGEISGIVATITGIAEQTNLLALNAAIEAARAGEQGRGFAVVAEEVRKLAEEAQQAAGTIATIIGDIQTQTGRTVEVVEEGAQRSADGAEVVEQARAAFTEITAAVQGVSARIEEIATSTSEVAAVAEQSSASTQQVSASTEQTSASTQEIAATAQQLAVTAGELEQLVGRFQLTAH